MPTYTPTTDGGNQIAITLTPPQAAAMLPNGESIPDYAETALWAIAALRTGTWGAGTRAETTPGPDQWEQVINDLEKYIRQLDGILDAAIREHAKTGGTYDDLSRAMNSARSTAQYRRDKVLARQPADRTEEAAARQEPRRH